MGSKKKKGAGGRRTSQSDFAAVDEMLAEVLAGSAKKGVATLPPAATLGTAPIMSTVSEGPTSTAVKDNEIAPSGGAGDGKCQHVKNAVKLPKLRRALAQQKDWDTCHGCQTMEIRAKKLAQRLDMDMDMLSLTENGSSGEALSPENLWMCLSCCEINCGRGIKKHGLSHHSTKSDHPLAINLGNMECWCYDCNDRIVPSKNKNQVVQECQIIIEKTLQIKHAKMRAASAALSKKSKVVATSTSAIKPKVFTPGLQNLGNTCFFNSVVQVLTETKSLRSMISEDHSGSEDFPKSLAATTDAGLGPLTTTFKDFLFTMWKQQGGTVAPRDLFTQIAKKWKVFRGFRQQDSQELMRYLFDGIKQEELDLIKRQIAEEKDSSASESATEEKENASEDETSASKYVPFIDSCFSGRLVSVIVCDFCKKCSYAPEDFFDLSLPVKGAPRLAEGSSLRARLMAQSKTSAEDPEASMQSSQNDTEDNNPIPASLRASDEHLQHVDRLLKSIGRSDSDNLSIERSLNQFTSVDCLDGDNKFACENCYKIRHPSATTAASLEGAKDSPAASEGTETASTKSTESEGTKTSDVANEDMSHIEAEEVASKDTSGSELESDDSEQETVDALGNTVPKVIKAPKARESKDSKDKVTEVPKHIFRKAFKRYLVASLPPTLVFHLKRFEQSGRFGQMRKIDDHVDIPSELDMTPYCIPRSDLDEEDEQVIAQGLADESVSKKYRLYGAVVHMGNLGGGHYTNYVLSSKVEVPPPEQEKAVKAGSQLMVNGLDLPDVPLATMLAQQKEKKKKGSAQAGQGVPEAPKAEGKEFRQWIACSDTSVRLSSLEEVLASRAYLLFYERC